MQQLAGLSGGEPGLPAAPSLNQDPEMVADFIMESREHLCAVEAQLLALEQDPQNKEAINTIFRGFHTIKGLAGFLDYPAIQSFAHEVETLLDLARNAKAPVNSALVDIVLQSADYMSQCLRGVESGIDPPEGVVGPLMARVQRTIAGASSGAGESSAGLEQLAAVV